MELIFDHILKSPKGYVCGMDTSPPNKGTVCANKIAAIMKNNQENDSYMKVHLKLGHLSIRTTMATAEKLGINITKKPHSCTSCQEGKAHQKDTKKITKNKVNKTLLH